MRLAFVMGRVNVDAMLSEITRGQFLEWLAYLELEPQGPNSVSMHNDMLTAVLAGRVRSVKPWLYEPFGGRLLTTAAPTRQSEADVQAALHPRINHGANPKS